MQSFNPHYHRSPGRALKRWFFFLIFLGVVGASLYWFFKRQGEDFPVTLTATKGNVEFRKSEKENWTTVDSLPLTMEKSSEVRTLNDSEAEIQMKDNGIIRLGSFTRLVLTNKQGGIDWVQTDGNTHHQILSNAGRKEYKLAISEGEISALGTAFEVKNRESDTTILGLNGSIKLDFKDKTSEEVKAGEKITLNPVGRKISEITEEDLKEAWTFQNLEKDQKNSFKIADGLLSKAGITEIPSEQAIGEGNETVSSDNQNSNDNSASTDSTENKSNNDNSNSNQSVEIKEKNETVSNVNNNNSNSITQSNSNSTSGTSNTTGDTSTSSTSTATTANATAPSSGTTTRGQCENSGGHWYSANKTCKCPPSNYFSGGKCNKK